MPRRPVHAPAHLPVAHLPEADERALAGMRCAAVPTIWAIGLLGYVPVLAGFHPAAAAALAWTLLTTRRVARAQAFDRAMALIAGVDVVVVGVLLGLSGGVDSRARHLAFVLPVALAFTCRPRQVLLVAGSIGAAYTAASTSAVLHLDGDALRTLTSFWISLSWATAASMLLAAARLRRDERISELVDDRVRLTSGLVDEQDLQRRTLAEELHDNALQHLLAARQDLEEAISGSDLELRQDAAKNLDAGITHLRAMVRERHPQALRRQGLREGLQAICSRQAPRGGFITSLSIEPDLPPGPHDEVLLECARELITNAAKHAGATNLIVTASRGGDEQILLRITDDGRGMPPGRATQALGEGHIGLAACGERARRHGGSLLIENAPGGGTTARLEMPIRAAETASAGYSSSKPER